METATVDKEWLIFLGMSPSSRWPKKTQIQYPGPVWIQPCPTLGHLEARLSGRVTPRAMILQYPHGGILALVLPQNRSKEVELLFWRETVPTGGLQLSVAKLSHCYFTVA